MRIYEETLVLTGRTHPADRLWHGAARQIMQSQGDLANALEMKQSELSDSLVLEDDDSTSEQTASMHVHFAYSQPSQSIDYTGSLTAGQLHPGRSKRGSFFPGHALASSSSIENPPESSESIFWSHSARFQHNSFMPRRDLGSTDSLDGPREGAISWSLNSRQHTTSSHATPQRVDRCRQAGGHQT